FTAASSHPPTVPSPSFIFLLITRPPPQSTLFPYTTLFRSRIHRNPTTAMLYMHALANKDGVLSEGGPLAVDTGLHTGRSPKDKRSEEHTSELQSLTNLVCRLLLEKKKHMHQETGTARVGAD